MTYHTHTMNEVSPPAGTTPGDILYWDGEKWVPDRRTKAIPEGYIQGNEYQRGDEVADGANLSEALIDGATEYPYVTPLGESFFLYQGTIGTDVTTAKQVISGQRITYGANGYLIGYRIYTVIGNEYEVYLIVDPLSQAPIVRPIAAFTGSADGWVEFSFPPTIMIDGDTVDLVYGVREPDPTPTTWTGHWDYQKPNNQTDPFIGTITHANRDIANIYVNYIDDNAADWEANLKALTVGDTITAAGVTWSIQSAVHDDLGGFSQFGVAPASQGSPTGAQDFVFETVTATPITTALDAGYWASNPFPNGTVQGLYIADGPYSDIVANDDAQGIDARVQDAYVPTEWLTKIVSSSGSSTGTPLGGMGGINSGGTDGYITASHTTTDNGFEDLLTMDISEDTGFVVDYMVVARRTDDYGYFSGRYNSLWSRNGSTENETGDYYEHSTEAGLRVREQVSGSSVVIQVDGKASQDWFWQIVLVNRGIT